MLITATHSLRYERPENLEFSITFDYMRSGNNYGKKLWKKIMKDRMNN